MGEKLIYRLNDKIAFRKCSLCDGMQSVYGDCTNFVEVEENWKKYYRCVQDGLHIHCAKHPEIELKCSIDAVGSISYVCDRCGEEIEVDNGRQLRNECLKMLNRSEFKDAKLVRLDDWYVPEVKKKIKDDDSGYWITADVKTDKDGDTIIVLYVGNTDSSQKAQFFIKPEKLQLSSDHKDMDPASVLARIEVELKDRKLIQKYDERD